MSGVELPTSQTSLHRFCLARPYLGVKLALDNDLEEVNKENSVTWTQVLLKCSDTNGKKYTVVNIRIVTNLLIIYMQYSDFIFKFCVLTSIKCRILL